MNRNSNQILRICDNYNLNGLFSRSKDEGILEEKYHSSFYKIYYFTGYFSRDWVTFITKPDLTVHGEIIIQFILYRS